MRNSIISLFILFTICAFYACDTERLTRCSGGDCENTLLENRVVEIIRDTASDENDTFVEIVAGDSLVFLHEFTTKDDPNIADDEYKDFVYFQIDPSWDSFAYTDADLAELNATYRFSCFCIGPFVHSIRKGSISGTRNGDRWRVEIDIEVEVGEDIVSKALKLKFQ